MPIPHNLNRTHAPAAVILIRILVGGIFLSEGIQKFLYPNLVGAGRFARIGIPYPEVTGPLVGVVEIIAGSLLLLGFATRFAAIVMLMNMCVAITATKLPVLLGREIWGFSLPKLQLYGVWSVLHEARTDLSMIFCLVFLLVVGAGRLSLDAKLWRRSDEGGHSS
jgi:putative oxidoreductase